MAIRVTDPLGITEIAELANVHRNTAWRWSQRPDFPRSAATLAQGSIWNGADVKKWLRQRPARGDLEKWRRQR